jgi:putative ATP-dependent endonuclease of OLD family
VTTHFASGGSRTAARLEGNLDRRTDARLGRGVDVHIESMTLTNFQCFGPEPVTIALDPALTVLVGANGTGKSAAFEALARLFGITQEERRVHPGDFHVPLDEAATPARRELSIDVVIAFPELAADDDEPCDASMNAVPEFFRHMAANTDGELKCRVRLEATWDDDGSVDGTVSEEARVIRTLAIDYTDDDWIPLRPLDRARIQMVTCPRHATEPATSSCSCVGGCGAHRNGPTS